MREKHIPGKNKSTREGSMTGDPGEAWVAGGDGLHGGMIGGKNGGTGTQGRVWKTVHIRSLPIPQGEDPTQVPKASRAPSIP